MIIADLTWAFGKLYQEQEKEKNSNIISWGITDRKLVKSLGGSLFDSIYNISFPILMTHTVAKK